MPQYWQGICTTPGLPQGHFDYIIKKVRMETLTVGSPYVKEN